MFYSNPCGVDHIVDATKGLGSGRDRFVDLVLICPVDDIGLNAALVRLIFLG